MRARVAIAVAACAALCAVDRSAVAPLRAAPQAPGAAAPGGLEILDVRANFFVIAGAGGNIGVQVGDDGVVVVDAGSAASAAAVVAAIKRITPKPIRYVIDTGPDADHVGGNEALSKAGETFFPNTRIGGQQRDFMAPVAAILATEGVLRRMSAPSGSTPAYPAGGWPTETFHYARKYMYLNGEAIEVLHQPAAHTDSDVVRVLPPVRRGDGRRRPRHAAVSRDRRRARREHPGRNRGAQPAVGAGRRLGADRVARSRHHRGPRPRPALRSVRRDRVPRHGDDRPRPRARSDRGRAVARRRSRPQPRPRAMRAATATRAATGRRTASSRPIYRSLAKEKP